MAKGNQENISKCICVYIHTYILYIQNYKKKLDRVIGKKVSNITMG